MDAVTTRFRANQQQDTARPPSGCRSQFLGGDQAHAHGVDQGILGVGLVKVNFAGHVGHADAVAVPGNALNHASEEMAVVSRVQGSETQRVQQGDGPCPHGQNVAHNAAHPGSRALEGLNSRWVVVGLDLEHNGESVADINGAGVFRSGPGQDPG